MSLENWRSGLIGLVAAIVACQGGGEEASTSGAVSSGAVAAASGDRKGADRNACDLITEAEVSAAAGVPVKARETNRESGRSDCGWFDSGDIFHMGLVGYWTGGPEG